MDEPDAYLSSSGQQDLLKIFDAFAFPIDDRRPCQVVYVTHSPFLIDKNHGERIRVLEKGEGEEGTRVVANAARNHYEPLRSAFGSFVAETTFISNCNLMVEGQSDQILLAGVTSHIRRRTGAPSLSSLDLNTLTLVPAGSASHIPYLVYLARGRDVERPAVVVLLDSDSAGDDAKSALMKAKGRARLDLEFIVQVGDIDSAQVNTDNPNGVVGIEDFVPLDVALAASWSYVREFIGETEAKEVAKVKPAEVIIASDGIHHGIERHLKGVLGDDFHLDKVGFARSIVDVVQQGSEKLSAQIGVLVNNFKLLFTELARRQRSALRELDVERTSSKVNRIRSAFFADHPVSASREEGLLLLEEIENALGSGPDAEQLSNDMVVIKREHDLYDDIVSGIEDYDKFMDDLHALAYAPVRAVQEPGS